MHTNTEQEQLKVVGCGSEAASLRSWVLFLAQQGRKKTEETNSR